MTRVSPLGALVAEIREEQLRKCASLPGLPTDRGFGRTVPASNAGSPGRPEPDLRLETRAVSRVAARTSSTSALFVASLLLHTAMAAALLVGPLLMADAFPLPTSMTRAFFVEPMLAPAPPPPPPPAPPAAAAPVIRPTPEARAFVAPIETADQIVPEESVDLGVPGGMPGGVEGGVPGGVVGGVVGGLPESLPPPSSEPVRVGGDIKEPRKLKHVDPVYPPLAEKAGVQAVVIVECILSPQGRVVRTEVLRGHPLLNDAALAAIRQWVYTPTLKDGVPVAVLLTATVSFRLQTGRR